MPVRAERNNYLFCSWSPFYSWNITFFFIFFCIKMDDNKKFTTLSFQGTVCQKFAAILWWWVSALVRGHAPKMVKALRVRVQPSHKSLPAIVDGGVVSLRRPAWSRLRSCKHLSRKRRSCKHLSRKRSRMWRHWSGVWTWWRPHLSHPSQDVWALGQTRG